MKASPGSKGIGWELDMDQGTRASTGRRAIDLGNTNILITGAAGFIGSNLAARLLADTHASAIAGIDNMSDYYDPFLKRARLDWIARTAGRSASSWRFMKASITDKDALEKAFGELSPRVVVHLAAQPGVRSSIENPDAYIENNIVGFFNVLEACRHHPVEHLVYASSSSVYGNAARVPFSTDEKADEPVSLYAATKRSGELLAHSYSSLYGIPMTGLRFFTVYGPYGRPDMFAYSATRRLIAGESIQLYGDGLCQRDFTYIDDIVEGIVRVMGCHRPAGDVPHALYNIGGGQPVPVLEFVSILQEELEKAGALPTGYDASSHRELVGMQPGDVFLTYADTAPLERDYGFRPRIGIREGLHRFVEWYLAFHGSEPAVDRPLG